MANVIMKLNFSLYLIFVHFNLNGLMATGYSIGNCRSRKPWAKTPPVASRESVFCSLYLLLAESFRESGLICGLGFPHLWKGEMIGLLPRAFVRMEGDIIC